MLEPWVTGRCLASMIEPLSWYMTSLSPTRHKYQLHQFAPCLVTIALTAWTSSCRGAPKASTATWSRWSPRSRRRSRRRRPQSWSSLLRRPTGRSSRRRRGRHSMLLWYEGSLNSAGWGRMYRRETGGESALPVEALVLRDSKTGS